RVAKNSNCPVRVKPFWRKNPHRFLEPAQQAVPLPFRTSRPARPGKLVKQRRGGRNCLTRSLLGSTIKERLRGQSPPERRAQGGWGLPNGGSVGARPRRQVQAPPGNFFVCVLSGNPHVHLHAM